MKTVNAAWPVMSLFEFCSPKQWPTIPQSALVEQGYPVYGANGKIGYYSEFNHDRPTVLITCRGATCGTINVCEPKSYVTGNAMALDDLDESRVSANYLVYALRNGSLAQAISGTAQPQITRQSLTAISIALPPLTEQRRIAEILDRADALRVKRRAALAQLDSLNQSIFLDFFGDPLAKNGKRPNVEFETVTQRITYGFTCPMKHLESGIPIVTAKNVRDGFIDFDNVHYADKAEFDLLTAKSKPVPGDVVITKDGTIGRCAVVETNQPFCINQSVALILPDRSKVLASYLVAYLSTSRVQHVMQNMGKGNALAHLQITELAKLPMPLPSLEQQSEFARRIEAVGKLKTIQSASLAELDNLFASLQHRAFRGEL